MNAPIIAPSICAAMYAGTSDQLNLPRNASAMVTAGFKCAPLEDALINTPVNTAIAQPIVITIQPLLNPFVLLSTTLATTPSPRIISIAVPISSPVKGVIHQIFKS